MNTFLHNLEQRLASAGWTIKDHEQAAARPWPLRTYPDSGRYATPGSDPGVILSYFWEGDEVVTVIQVGYEKKDNSCTLEFAAEVKNGKITEGNILRFLGFFAYSQNAQEDGIYLPFRRPTRKDLGLMAQAFQVLGIHPNTWIKFTLVLLYEENDRANNPLYEKWAEAFGVSITRGIPSLDDIVAATKKYEEGLPLPDDGV